jgi:hypothetical protein
MHAMYSFFLYLTYLLMLLSRDLLGHQRGNLKFKNNYVASSDCITYPSASIIKRTGVIQPYNSYKKHSETNQLVSQVKSNVDSRKHELVDKILRNEVVANHLISTTLKKSAPGIESHLLKKNKAHTTRSPLLRSTES